MNDRTGFKTGEQKSSKTPKSNKARTASVILMVQAKAIHSPIQHT